MPRYTNEPRLNVFCLACSINNKKKTTTNNPRKHDKLPLKRFSVHNPLRGWKMWMKKAILCERWAFLSFRLVDSVLQQTWNNQQVYVVCSHFFSRLKFTDIHTWNQNLIPYFIGTNDTYESKRLLFIICKLSKSLNGNLFKRIIFFFCFFDGPKPFIQRLGDGSLCVMDTERTFVHSFESESLAKWWL